VDTALPAVTSHDSFKGPYLPLDDPAQFDSLMHRIAQHAAHARPRVLLRSILPLAAYATLDAVGIQAVQCIPAAWFDEVATRLAHHPCLVAWCSEVGTMPPSPASLALGRQVVSPASILC
jgi:hypothetical protein